MYQRIQDLWITDPKITDPKRTYFTEVLPYLGFLLNALQVLFYSIFTIALAERPYFRVYFFFKQNLNVI